MLATTGTGGGTVVTMSISSVVTAIVATAVPVVVVVAVVGSDLSSTGFDNTSSLNTRHYYHMGRFQETASI